MRTGIVEMRTSIVKGPLVDLTQKQTEGTPSLTEDTVSCTSKEPNV